MEDRQYALICLRCKSWYWAPLSNTASILPALFCNSSSQYNFILFLSLLFFITVPSGSKENHYKTELIKISMFANLSFVHSCYCYKRAYVRQTRMYFNAVVPKNKVIGNLSCLYFHKKLLNHKNWIITFETNMWPSTLIYSWNGCGKVERN